MKDISRTEWKDFFDAFSREHKGWLVSAEVLSEEMGDQPEAETLPFVGAMAEKESNGEQNIVIIYGTTPESHVSHTITSPQHVRLDGGTDEKYMQIESADKTATILRFQRAKSAETSSR